VPGIPLRLFLPCCACRRILLFLPFFLLWDWCSSRRSRFLGVRPVLSSRCGSPAFFPVISCDCSFFLTPTLAGIYLGRDLFLLINVVIFSPSSFSPAAPLPLLGFPPLRLQYSNGSVQKSPVELLFHGLSSAVEGFCSHLFFFFVWSRPFFCSSSSFFPSLRSGMWTCPVFCFFSFFLSFFRRCCCV